MEKELKVKPIIISLIVIMILVVVVGIALYITTDLFKSSEILFKKYIAQNVKNIVDVVDISNEEQIFDIMQNRDYTDQAEIKLSYLENENDEEEVYTLNESGSISNSGKKSNRSIEVTYNDEVLSKVDLLGQDDLFGFRLSNLVQQFVSVRNENISYFISSMGYDGQYFEETLNKVDLSGLFHFSDEEIQTLTNSYVKIIFDDISPKSYSSRKDSLITLNNGQSVSTNAYSLTITKNDLDKIYKRILNQAINDQIILSKLDQLDNKLEEIGIVMPEEETIHNRYVENLQKISNEIEYEGEDTRQITITVYETQGTTVRTTIKTETNEILIDLDETNGKALSLKNSELTDQGNDVSLYLLGIEKNGEETIRTIGYSNNVEDLQIKIDNTKNNEEIETEIKLNYTSDKITKLNVDATAEINLLGDSTVNTTFEEENNYILNDYELDRVTDILETLKGIFINSLEESQSKINTKLLNNILIWIDQKEQEQENQRQNDIELQKQKFNNQFILYAGENLNYNHVTKMLEIVGKNMSDYNVVSGTQIRIFIEPNKENLEKAEEIEGQLDNNHTYNIEINYSQDGYVNSIDLSVYKRQ